MFDARTRRFALVFSAVTATWIATFQAPTSAYGQGSGLHDVSAGIVDITVLTAAGNRHSCGFVVGSEGLIATNYSHLNGVENVTVKFANGMTYDQILFHAVDVPRDLVILQVPATGLSPIPFGDSEPIRAGDEIQTTCCGFDPLCADQWAEVSEVTTHESGVKIMRFTSPPVPWMPGAPIVDKRGQAVGIANTLIADQSTIAVTSNDIQGALRNPLSPSVTLAEYIEFINSQAAGGGAEGSSTSGQQQTTGNTGHQPWSMAGNWRVPNQDSFYMFVEDQGQLKGKEILITGGSKDSFFILDRISDTEYRGIHHFLWGCAYKKGVLGKQQSKTCHVQWGTTLEQSGPDNAVIQYEGFAEGLPNPGDKSFIKVCESCGESLPKKNIRYEIMRTR